MFNAGDSHFGDERGGLLEEELSDLDVFSGERVAFEDAFSHDLI